MKQYSFIDMHIHTAFSDEEKCDMTIEQLLKKAQERAQRTGQDCVISIADHNTILGVKKAREILSSPEGKAKYPNVVLINGIEFTTDLCELANQFGGHRVFTRCHTLAYGYDENDTELTAYSRITHKMFTFEDNVGMQICAARRALCEKYGLDLPFTLFEDMAELGMGAKFKDEFLSRFALYAQEHKLKINLNEASLVISPYILNHVDYVREASSFGRLKLSEIAKLVKGAGGELVVAHPSLIRVTVKGLEHIARQEGLSLSDVYVPDKRKYNNNTDLSHVKMQKLVFEYFIDAFNKTCGGGTYLRGIEKYYSSNYRSRLDKIIETICAERGLFETCGSDYHGIHLHPDKMLGNVFTDTILERYESEYSYVSSDRCPMVVSGLTAVEHFLGDRTAKLPNQTKFVTDRGVEIPQEVYEHIISITSKNATHIGVTQSSEDAKSSYGFEARIAELTEIVEKFNQIIATTESKAKRAKLLLRLNLFSENVYEALKVLRDKSANNYAIRTMPEYEKIVKLMAEIQNQFKSLLRYNPLMIKDLKNDMRHYYKKKTVTIHRLAELDFLPPVTATKEDNTRNA